MGKRARRDWSETVPPWERRRRSMSKRRGVTPPTSGPHLESAATPEEDPAGPFVSRSNQSREGRPPCRPRASHDGEFRSTDATERAPPGDGCRTRRRGGTPPTSNYEDRASSFVIRASSFGFREAMCRPHGVSRQRRQSALPQRAGVDDWAGLGVADERTSSVARSKGSSWGTNRIKGKRLTGGLRVKPGERTASRLFTW